MTEDYELTINYPPQLMSPAHDAVFCKAVGDEYLAGSGAGVLTGGRDLNFSFKSRLEAEAALHRIKALGNDLQYRWMIEHWEWTAEGEVENHRTLAMGVNGKAREKSNEAEVQA